MPTGPALEPFSKELAEYKTGKDTIQFPYDKPLPKALIRRIASYRAKQVRRAVSTLLRQPDSAFTVAPSSN